MNYATLSHDMEFGKYFREVESDSIQQVINDLECTGRVGDFCRSISNLCNIPTRAARALVERYVERRPDAQLNAELNPECNGISPSLLMARLDGCGFSADELHAFYEEWLSFTPTDDPAHIIIEGIQKTAEKHAAEFAKDPKRFGG